MKSNKSVKILDEILRPYPITFPVSVEGSINGKNFYFKSGVAVEIDDYSIYEALMHSSYAKYLESMQTYP